MKLLKSYDNEQGETLQIFSNCVKIIVPKIGFWKSMKRAISACPEGEYEFSIENIQASIHKASDAERYYLRIKSSGVRERGLFARNENNLKKMCEAILETQLNYRKEKAIEREGHLDYHGAIELYEIIGMPKEAARVRRLMYDEKKVDQTVVHGDYVDDRDTTYVDDRDTIIQDSVVSKSNVGAGGKSKAEEIKEIKELLDSGAIDDDEFKQMKKEILGK